MTNTNKNLPETKMTSSVWSNFFFSLTHTPAPTPNEKRFLHFPSQRRSIQAWEHVNVTVDVILPPLESFTSSSHPSETFRKIQVKEYQIKKNPNPFLKDCYDLFMNKVAHHLISSEFQLLACRLFFQFCKTILKHDPVLQHSCSPV